MTIAFVAGWVFGAIMALTIVSHWVFALIDENDRHEARLKARIADLEREQAA